MRIGADVSERLHYPPASLFVHATCAGIANKRARTSRPHRRRCRPRRFRAARSGSACWLMSSKSRYSDSSTASSLIVRINRSA
ncbi:MAG: hypothetical protein AB7K24_19805 [Gemmataceae bacterium]